MKRNKHQPPLFAGLDCLPGQLDLFATDGEAPPPERQHHMANSDYIDGYKLAAAGEPLDAHRAERSPCYAAGWSDSIADATEADRPSLEELTYDPMQEMVDPFGY